MPQLNLLALNNDADIHSPEALLDRALQYIIDQMDGVNRADVFRLARGGMVVWHSTNNTLDSGTFIPLTANSPQQQAILQGVTVESDDTQRVILPLRHQGQIYALLELFSDSEYDLDSMNALANDLSVMLYAQQADTLLHSQIAVVGRMSIATSLADVATIMGETMLQPQQFVSVNVFDYDETQTVTGAKVVATANRQQAFPTDLPMSINLSAIQALHSNLLQDGEVLINDVPGEDRFSELARAWLTEQKIQSMYILPMWIASHLSSFIVISDTTRALAPTALEKELFQNVVHQATLMIERQQLLEKTQRTASRSDEEARVLRLLNNLIAQANNNTLDKPLLQETADILYEALSVDHVGIVMREGNLALVVSEAPEKGLVGRSVEITPDSIHPLLEKTRQPFIAEDVANSPDMPDATRKALMDAKVQSVIVIPMFDENDHLLGSVGLDYFSKQTEIDPNLVETAQTIVSQVALTLQKSSLLQEAQKKAQQLEDLTEFGQALRAHLIIEEILRTTLQYCPDVMQTDYVGVLLYDRPNNAISNNAVYLNGEHTIRLDAPTISEDDNSIAVQAWTTHELIRVDDLHSDWSWKHELHRELQSIMAIPLSLAGITLGVLEVGSATPNHFSATDETTLTQIANQLAIALSNSSAYSQSQRLARNKTQANDIIAKLQEQLEVSDILTITVHELGQALGAKKARIRLGTPPKKVAGES